MAIVLTIIGTLLTALVVAREWERGTMEALLATPVGRLEMLLGKIVPYFALGMVAMGLSVGASVWLFGLPFRGSVLALVVVSSAYLVAMLTLGLLISTRTKNQFVACQAALIVGFLPAFELSGFIFEIDSMPAPIRLLTMILPPRYYVSSLQTLFLTGDVPAVLVPNTLVLAGLRGRRCSRSWSGPRSSGWRGLNHARTHPQPDREGAPGRPPGPQEPDHPGRPAARADARSSPSRPRRR